MKNRVITAIALSLAFVSSGFAGSTYVRGYARRDGTYVSPHYRSSPDASPYNNYSYKGNVNPYTGKVGTDDYESTSPKWEYKSYDYKPSTKYQWND